MSLLKIGAFVAMAAVEVVAANPKWYLQETYDSSNFFDKFNFWVSRYNTGIKEDIDPTHGYVQYLNKADSTAKGLIGTAAGGDVFIGVDHTKSFDPLGTGRYSVRLESTKLYNHGLFIGRFSHFPKPVCGSWPAFWSYGDPWPAVGEIDIYEGFNEAPYNKPTFHTNYASVNGTCTVSQNNQRGTVETSNCDNWADNQDWYAGCRSADPQGAWGNENGGVVAMEWTSQYIKTWTWPWGKQPGNIGASSPDTSSWGLPSSMVSNDLCNVDGHFANQKLVFDITFCGDVASDPTWASNGCGTKTKTKSCAAYVAGNPGDFADVYWQIQDLRVFGNTPPPVTTTSTTSSKTSTSTTSSKTSTSTSSSKTSTTSSTTSTTSTTSSKSSTTSTTSSSSSTKSTTSSSSSTSTSSKTSTSSSSSTLTPTSTSTSTTSSSSSSSSTSSSASSATPTSTSTSSSSASSSSSTTSNAATDTTSSSSSATTTSYTTSTVYTTKVRTITSCPPTVTNCPAGHASVVTDTIALYTTVCPVTATATTTSSRGGHQHSHGSGAPSQTHSHGHEGPHTITTTKTNVYTITSCHPTVTNCPVGKVVTELVTTTYCPGETATKSKSTPAHQDSTTAVVVKTVSVVPQKSASASASHGSGSYGSNSTKTASAAVGTGSAAGSCSGAGCPGKVTVSAGVRAGVSAGLMGLAALAVFAL